MKKWYAFIALGLIIVSCTPSRSDRLQASGMIEAVEIAVAPEISGQIVAVLVNEGASVQEGDVLLRLDDELLRAQRFVAEAALVSAQATLQAAEAALETAEIQYDLLLDSALVQSIIQREQQWRQNQPAGIDLPFWYFNQSEQIAALEAASEAAAQRLTDAQVDLEDLKDQVGGADFITAETNLIQAQMNYSIALATRDQMSSVSDAQELRSEAQAAVEDALDLLKDAQEAYDDALTSEGAQDILEARARLAVEQAYYDSVRAAIRGLYTGIFSPEVLLAGQAVEEGRALVSQAQAAVTQAEAGLDLIDLQLDKLTLYAMIDGVVLTLGVDEGEVVQAGMTVIEIADLERLSVIVYISEDRYGTISIGDQASLSVDSYPDDSFTGIVTRIADQAEYTPRNVQTQEERQVTVYAVEVSIENPDSRLKPGMPVDVIFGE